MEASKFTWAILAGEYETVVGYMQAVERPSLDQMVSYLADCANCSVHDWTLANHGLLLGSAPVH